MALLPVHGGLFAVVDDDALGRLSGFRWRVHCGYVARTRWAPERQVNRNFYLHREIAGDVAGMVVDHINGDVLDNRAANLRHVTHGGNARNRGPTRGRRFKGITFNRAVGKWQAAIQIERRSRYLGVFSDEESAARAYDAAARTLFGEFARLNFPEVA